MTKRSFYFQDNKKTCNHTIMTPWSRTTMQRPWCDLNKILEYQSCFPNLRFLWSAILQNLQNCVNQLPRARNLMRNFEKPEDKQYQQKERSFTPRSVDDFFNKTKLPFCFIHLHGDISIHIYVTPFIILIRTWTKRIWNKLVFNWADFTISHFFFINLHFQSFLKWSVERSKVNSRISNEMG